MPASAIVFNDSLTADVRAKPDDFLRPAKKKSIKLLRRKCDTSEKLYRYSLSDSGVVMVHCCRQ
jgi:hypothetical protein